jgi:hypothetical protein
VKYTPAQMTDWVQTAEQPPVHHGEYNASVLKSSVLVRWWNGEYWSEPYMDTFSEESKQRLRRKRSMNDPRNIYYRGLRVKPRVHSIHYLLPLK